MATASITLPVTADFIVPSLLKDATPEMCVHILLAGVAAVECANDAIGTATNETLTTKLTTKYETQLARAQKETDTERLRFQKVIERLQADADLAKTMRAEAENRVAEATAQARQQAYADAEERIRKAALDVQKAEEKANEFQKQLLAEQRESSAAVLAEKHRTQELVHAERDRSDRLLEEKQRTIEVLHGLGASSSRKGDVYEQKIKYCIVNAFGTVNKFDIVEKQYESGDHIFEWGDYKVMVEDKDKKEIDAEDIRKAHRDFTHHSECDILLFISARAHVPKHQRPGDIDIAIVDGRPAIYLGHFNDKENKILYLKSLQPVMRTLIELTKKATDSPDAINEKLGDKLRSIRQHFIYNEMIINELVNKAKAAQRNITGSIDELMLTIVNVQSMFKNSMASVINDEDTTIPIAEEASVEEEKEKEKEPTPIKVTGKRHQVPKKKGT